MNRKRTRRLSASVAVSAVAALAAMSLGAAPAQAEGIILDADQPHSIEGSYIVALKDDAAVASVDSLATAYDGTIDRTFVSINGFSTSMSETDARRLAADPAVEYVAQDGVVSLADTQTDPPWGLDRIDQRNLPLDGEYTYPPSAGEGVTAYIIDTGADLDHPDFGDRMTSGRDTVDGDDDAEDCQGHGTHVAGTVGGIIHGVAKKVDLVAVRVLDCSGSGSFAGVIEGIDWVTENAQLPAVANMSLGGGFSQAVNDAVEASINAGVTYSLAAGNDYGADACNGSPASTEPALTVGATDGSDNRASFSNIGSCVDVFAPGVDVLSAWLNGGTNTISGTSMAAPHVAGVAALHLGEYPDATPVEVGEAITSNATEGVIGNPGAGSPNRLLYMGYLNEGNGGDGFSVTVNPASGSVSPGESVTAAVDTATTSGEAQTVELTAEGAPSGMSVSIDPSSLTTGDSATLTIETSADTDPGTYTITVAAAGTVTRSAGYTVTVIGEGGACAGTNDAATPLPDAQVVESVIDVACDGVASAGSTVTVDITHTWRGDLRIELVSPDGTVYLLKAQNLFDSAPDVNETYTLDLSGESGGGDWTLRITDHYFGDTGTLNGWSVNL